MTSGDDLMQIGRFARLANLSVHQLRHYHEVGLLVPARVDEESGYRYYASPQKAVADLIALLRSLDLPLADVRRLLASPDRETAGEILSRHRRHLEERFREAERRLQAFERLLEEGSLHMRIEIPRDPVPVKVRAVRMHPPSGQHVVLLYTEDEASYLPIWIGAAEAAGIELHRAGQTPDRPTSFDLMSSLALAGGVAVRAVTIWQPEEETALYVAAVELEGPERTVLDARPSHAINLALRLGAPIRVSAATLQRAARRLSDPELRVGFRSEEGDDLGEGRTWREPAAGDHLYTQRTYEIVAVAADAADVRIATVRELPDTTRRTIAKP